MTMFECLYSCMAIFSTCFCGQNNSKASLSVVFQSLIHIKEMLYIGRSLNCFPIKYVSKSCIPDSKDLLSDDIIH